MIQVPLKGVYDLQPYEIDLTVPALEAVKSLPEKMHTEVIDGHLYVMEAPSSAHAEVSFELAMKLGIYVKARKLGKVFMENLGVFTKTSTVRPDVLFVSQKNVLLIKQKGLMGPADLCIEVLSPGTKTYNFTTKKKLYEKFRVREYWLVDPITKETYGFLLKNGKYGDPMILKGKISIRILNKVITF